MIVLCVILGIIAGFCLAFSFVVHRVKRSNDFGDSTATFYDFSADMLHIITMKDKI